jgi:uncharacterized membrane protein
LIAATELTVGKEPLAESLFAFKSEGLEKEADVIAAAALVKYADIKSIIDKNCLPCHGGETPAKGINLTSYEGMSMARPPLWVAGQPENSRLHRVIKSGKMPPNNPMSADSLAKLDTWIKGGAQK